MATANVEENTEPTIIGSVRIDKVTYPPGSEKALAKVLTKDQIVSLTAQGVIANFAPKSSKKKADEGSEGEGGDETK